MACVGDGVRAKAHSGGTGGSTAVTGMPGLGGVAREGRLGNAGIIAIARHGASEKRWP